MPKTMTSQTRQFAFREQGRAWIIRNGFYYVDSFGWCHADGYCAIIEFTPKKGVSWTVAVYKSAVPPRPAKESLA